MLADCGLPLRWTGLYRQDYDLATPESMAHPAKASWDLAFRILNHLKELGLLKDQDTILDPMSGTGRFNLAACALGHKSIAVELEEKFVKFIQENKAYASKKLCLSGFELPLEIIQGDARKLSELLQGKGLVGIVSPPFGDLMGRESHEGPSAHGKGIKPSTDAHYGETEGQIGALPDKPIAVTSPPWNLQSGGRGEASRKSTPDEGLINRHGGGIKGGTGESPGNIGALPDRPVAIVSPPYEATSLHGVDTNPERLMGGPPAKTSHGGGQIIYANPVSQGQIGQEQGETYLSAMAQVYAELAKVSNVLVVVVKCPTRNGKLRRLDLDTIALLEACGWRINCVHHSMLFEELEQGHLFEGSQKRVKGRMSFFKRLAYQKGSPVADHEDIIFSVKGNGGSLKAVVSPPYGFNSPNLEQGDGLGGPIGNKARKRDKRKPRPDPAILKDLKGYGSTPGQIGVLPDRPLVAITSPPYGDVLTDQKPLSERTDGLAKELRKQRPKTYDKTGAGSAGKGYGKTSGQIGELKEK